MFVKAASLARSSLFCDARKLDLLKKLQVAWCLLSPRLSVALSHKQPRAPQDTIEKRSRIQRASSKSRMGYTGYVTKYWLQLRKCPSASASHQCGDRDEPSRCTTGPALEELESAPVLDNDRMTGRTRSRQVPQNKQNPKPYKRDGFSTPERRYFNNSLRLNDSTTRSLTDAQRSKDILERRIKHLSAEAAAQAVATMHADVERRRVCALATAWEIYATEEHLKFLHMVLEDEGETYANAAREPLKTSVGELVRCSEDELKDQIDSCVTAYSHDVISFAVGDTQLDYLENTHSEDSDDSGIGLTNSDGDHFCGEA
ncbi:hypothetical protein DEU56DRAFT_761491 [Suillus clintonianus]|uniref:uncharacterized protein n=1 Tax=Suillus clintonianus TaxID=1904413 RepID=UPI001B8636D8|nr:uncharacterized protein DEU56DRAFT_761491 [Suillus clintonianus]KAG2116813.1 hypothetical protein DEU56DRAFT_761491 [Suillus clintonianus]